MSGLSASGEILNDYRANKAGASFFTFINAGTVVHTLVLPASNVRGVVLRTAHIYSTNNLLLVADTAAPANATDTTKRAIAAIFSGTFILPRSLLLPTGYGLYMAFDGGTNRTGITLDIL